MANNTQKISKDLYAALCGELGLSIDLYVEVLAGFEDELTASLAYDADDLLLCILADEGRVAMMIIDWDGRIRRNEHALQYLKTLWKANFETNIIELLPILSAAISKKNLGVTGIKYQMDASG